MRIFAQVKTRVEVLLNEDTQGCTQVKTGALNNVGHVEVEHVVNVVCHNDKRLAL